MVAPISTVLNLTRSDLGRQKRRLSVAAALYVVTALFALFAIGFAMVALSIYLSEIYGMMAGLLMVACLSLTVSAMAIIINALYQRRQKRKLAQSAAVKGAAAATMLTIAKNRASIAPLILAGVGFLAASQLSQKNG